MDVSQLHYINKNKIKNKNKIFIEMEFFCEAVIHVLPKSDH